MSNFAAGVATGMIISNSEQSSDSTWNIKIAQCNALTTKQETFACLQQVEKQKDHQDNLFCLFFLIVLLVSFIGCVICAIIN